MKTISLFFNKIEPRFYNSKTIAMLHMTTPTGTKSLRRLCLSLTFLCFSLVSLAQVKKVSGVVTDSTGSPVQGVSVVLLNKKSGTSTDASGRFTISAATGNILVFTYGNQEAARVT